MSNDSSKGFSLETARPLKKDIGDSEKQSDASFHSKQRFGSVEASVFSLGASRRRNGSLNRNLA
jgi:hypothetical protein